MTHDPGLSRLSPRPPHIGRSRNRRSERESAPEPQVAAAPAQRVLALQRQIGNRAVGALLARAPTPKTPPKMPAPKPPELKDGIYAIVPGIGTIELNSAQIGMLRPTTSPVGRSTSREPAAPPTEIVVTSHLGDHSDKIFRWSVVGRSRDR